MKYLFCYDISEPKRLASVAKILNEKGFRVQYSFFCCDIDKETATLLFQKLEKEIDVNTDSLHMFPICEKCFGKIWNFGKKGILSFPHFLML